MSGGAMELADPRMLADPVGYWAGLREAGGPVQWSDAHRGWLVLSHREVPREVPVELIVTRDALVHLPDRQVKRVLDNFNKVRIRSFLLYSPSSLADVILLCVYRVARSTC